MSDVTAIVVGQAAGLSGLHEIAARATTPLVWLLDETAIASAATLPALVEHADAPAASLPVDSSGVPVEFALGRIDDDDADAVLACVRERRVPLRHAPVISLLVERELVLEIAPPDERRFGSYAGTEWTSRVFAQQTGMLIPASRVEVTAPPQGSTLQAVRMARSGAWRRGEALRELHRVTVGRG